MSFTLYVSGVPSVYQAPLPVGHAVPRVAPISPTQPIHQASPHFELPNQTKGHSHAQEYARHQDHSTARHQVILARDIMKSPVVTIAPGATLEHAWAIFTEKHFRHVPIVDKEGKLLGVISDRDLLGATSVLAHKNTPPPKTVKELMRESVLSATPDTEIRTVARVFVQEHIGSMPITEGTGHVVGIITRSDILRTLMNNVPLELWL